MSGICGMLGSPDREILRQMVHVMHHRGDDHTGVEVIGPCGLGATQFHTLSSAPQPLAADTRRWLVYDGEIYNYGEVRAALQAFGHKFTSEGDAETVLRSYIQFGQQNFVKPYRGKYAFAIWDGDQLLLVRDRLGQKPLFYTQVGDTFVFASEIKALFQHPDVSARPNRAALPYYLTFGYAPPPSTLFEGIFAVPPGHMLSLTPGGEPRIQRHWEPPHAQFGEDPRSEANIAADLLAHLRGTTRLRVKGDNPMGILLSGGLNSAAILALIAEFGPPQLRTFSLTFKGDDPGDAMIMRKLRARLMPIHQDIELNPNPVALLKEVVTLYDQPAGNPDMLTLLAANRALKEHADILIGGHGGDELFAGYQDFRIAQLASLYDTLPDIAQRAIGGAVDRLPSTQQPIVRRASQITQTANLPLSERYLTWIRRVSGHYLDTMIGAETDASIREQYAALFPKDGNADDLIAPLLDANLRTYLPYSLLPMLDQSGMGAGIEIRTPFLDHQLVQYAAGIPSSLKLKRGTSQYILRESLSEMLPRRVLESRSKRSLRAPINAWMRGALGELVEAYLLSGSPRTADLINIDPVREMFTAHREGQAELGHGLWTLLALEMWLKRFS